MNPLPVLLFALLAAAPASALSAEARVVVLGFDGADARAVERMMSEGELPNLARLAETGTFAPLTSTNPAESAAGWAAINTGLNPAANGVPSFIVRKFYGTSGPGYAPGHIDIVERDISELEPGGPLGVLAGTEPWLLAAGAGVVVGLAFLVVFGLLLRVRRTVAIPLALVLGGVAAWGALHARSYVPKEITSVFTNQVTADAFWDHAARGGVPSIVLDAALAFGRPEVEGARVLSGLGLPDVRGGLNGEWFVYTTDELELSRPPKGDRTSTNSGYVFRVDERDGRIETELYGPLDFWKRGELRAEVTQIEERLKDPGLGWKESSELQERKRELEESLRDENLRLGTPLVVERVGDEVRVTIGGESQELAEGEWSDWYRPSFSMNPVVRVSSITRVRIDSLRDPFRMYVGPLQIDPSDPVFWQPVSQPVGFSGELEDWIGEPYETLGWSCMTNEIKDDKVDIQSFLEDLEFTMEWRKKLTYAALERDDWRLLFSVFSTPDRAQHMLYKFYDPGHPRFDEAQASREVTFFGQSMTLRDTIPAVYREIDEIVGHVADSLREDDALLLCADHGFTSFRRGMHVNNWLAEKGYLTLKEGVSKGDASMLGRYVDWSRTQAYALGLGMVFLNLEGREPEGIVTREEADELLQRIRADFLEATDPETGVLAGADAMIVKDVYPGEWGTLEYRCADLMLGFAENYRVSWTTVSGGIRLDTRDGAVVPGETFGDNTNAWSGDHASNSPALVQGIYFSNRPTTIPEGGVSVMHIAPTVLSLLGVVVPEDLDLPPLQLE